MKILTTLLLPICVASAAPGDRLARGEDPVVVDFQTLMSFEYEVGGGIPDEVLELDGQRIRIDGYTDQNTPEGSRVFWLTSDACGCNGTPKLNHFVEVTLQRGKIGYRPDLLTLEGDFSVGEVEEDGFIVSLYRLEVESLR